MVSIALLGDHLCASGIVLELYDAIIYMLYYIAVLHLLYYIPRCIYPIYVLYYCIILCTSEISLLRSYITKVPNK